MDIARFSRIAAPDLIAEVNAQQQDPGRAEDFKGLLREGFQRLEQLETQAGEQVQALMRGEPVELHRVILAGEEAGLAFDAMLAVRNKVVEAYQEIMRMQV